MARKRSTPEPADTPKTISEPVSNSTKLAALLSAMILVAVGAIFTPLGTKLVNLVWPDPTPAATTNSAAPLSTTVATDGCQSGTSVLSVSVDYAFTGARWWATGRKLPPTTLEQLNDRSGGDTDPSKILKDADPVISQDGAGSLLKLIVTGCGPKPVLLTNMYATITKRDKPLSGGIVYWPPQGNLEVTPVAFNLDTPRPAALTYDWITRKTGGAYFAANAIQVAPGESVPFTLMGLTARSYIEWSVAIEASVDGKPWSFTVALLGGRSIRSTALAPSYQSAIILDVVVGYKQLDSAAFMAEMRRYHGG